MFDCCIDKYADLWDDTGRTDCQNLEREIIRQSRNLLSHVNCDGSGTGEFKIIYPIKCIMKCEISSWFKIICFLLPLLSTYRPRTIVKNCRGTLVPF